MSLAAMGVSEGCADFARAETEFKMAVDEMSLNVATPAGVFVGTFPKTAKVEDVIAAAIAAKGLDENETFELFWNGEALAPVTRTLVSFGLEDGAELELVATGSGV